MMDRLIDAHCHLDLFSNPVGVIEATRDAGVRTIAVTTTPTVYRQCCELVTEAPSISVAAGLHPELMTQRLKELPLLLDLIRDVRFVGEVGLDFRSPDVEERREQTAGFAAIVQRCTEVGDRVLTIHSRRAVMPVLDIIGGSLGGIAILHWFAGTQRELERAIGLGCYFSVNPAMLRSSRGRALTAAMPRDRVLTETDGPFVRIGDRPATPPDVRSVLRDIGALWRLPEREVSDVISQNFLRIDRN